MHRRSTALSSLALAFASLPFGAGRELGASLRADKLDGRVGTFRDGRVGIAAPGSAAMSPAQLVARSTYLAHKRQTHPGKRRGRR